MEITIPRITKVIALKDYAPEFGDATITVWVNPPRKVLVEIDELNGKPFDSDTYSREADIIGQLWDCPPEDVIKLFEHSKETDPLLFQWLMTKTFILIRDHRTQIKKN